MIDRNEVGIVNGLTVKQVSELSGVSIRTLQYYDNIGLLTPSERTEAGYRLYEEEQLATLQEILLFRELEFPLKEIKAILESPAHDREKALRQQVKLLTLKKERLEGLIRLADDLRHERKTTMDFTAFDKTKLEEYAKRAREEYSGTDAYKEYEVKSAGRTAETEAVLGRNSCRPCFPGRTGAGPGAAGLHHGALLHLYSGDPGRPWQNVRRGR